MASMTGLEFPAQILAKQLGNGDRTNPPDAESILSIFIQMKGQKFKYLNETI